MLRETHNRKLRCFVCKVGDANQAALTAMQAVPATRLFHLLHKLRPVRSRGRRSPHFVRRGTRLLRLQSLRVNLRGNRLERFFFIPLRVGESSEIGWGFRQEELESLPHLHGERKSFIVSCKLTRRRRAGQSRRRLLGHSARDPAWVAGSRGD